MPVEQLFKLAQNEIRQLLRQPYPSSNMPDTVFQGEATFQGTTPQMFRFEVIVLNGNQHLMIWLEDRVTKKQWQTDVMSLSEFITTANGIPGATIDHYAKRFAECLEKDVGSKHLTPEPKDGCRKLQIKLKLEWDVLSTMLTYECQLKEVPLDRVDLITSRVRDVEENLEKLTRHLRSAEDGEANNVRTLLAALTKRVDDLAQRAARSVVAHAQPEIPAQKGRLLVWVEMTPKSSAFTFYVDGSICFNMAGSYFISLYVEQKHTSDQQLRNACELVHLEQVVMSVDSVVQLDRRDNYFIHTVSMQVVLTVKAGDRMSVRITSKAPRDLMFGASKPGVVCLTSSCLSIFEI